MEASGHPILVQSEKRGRMARILVTGGAGYIGAHTVYFLLRAGHEVIVVDNLCRGHRRYVDPARLRVLDIRETRPLAKLLRQEAIDAVIHFAAYAYVGESMEKPEIYFDNNVAGTVSLLNAMTETGVRYLVFSSSAAVYGVPREVPIPEDNPVAPVNPYGESKAMVERMLAWMDRCRGLRSISLRYFNACGVEPGSGLGEEHDPETHLIPLVLRAARTGEPVTIFGDDYATPDGTCIRDYVHVSDLATAHLAALDWLLQGGPSEVFNVGTGKGHSVMEVVRTAETVVGKQVPYQIGPRRLGDPPVLVASPEKIQRTLNWRPVYTRLEDMIRTAWEFEKTRN